MTVQTMDGEDVALRLYTPDELLALPTANGETPTMTREQAENLTRSHDLWALLEKNQTFAAWRRA